jgi:hypothetical protein
MKDKEGIGGFSRLNSSRGTSWMTQSIVIRCINSKM